MPDSPFPFTAGSARDLPDAAAEVERLAAARTAGEMVAVPRADVAILAEVARWARRLAGDNVIDLPDGVTIDDVTAVLERHVDC